MYVLVQCSDEIKILHKRTALTKHFLFADFLSVPEVDKCLRQRLFNDCAFNFHYFRAEIKKKKSTVNLAMLWQAQLETISLRFHQRTVSSSAS